MKKQQGARLERDECHEAPGSAPSSSQVRPKANANQCRMLLVDDCLEVRATATLILRSRGFDVIEVANGDQAISCLQALGGVIDVVLLDMQMPGMDGLETLRALKAIRSSVKVVLYSGAGRSDRIDQALCEGVIAFMDKPFSPDDLAALLARCADPNDLASEDRG